MHIVLFCSWKVYIIKKESKEANASEIRKKHALSRACECSSSKATSAMHLHRTISHNRFHSIKARVRFGVMNHLSASYSSSSIPKLSTKWVPVIISIGSKPAEG